MSILVGYALKETDKARFIKMLQFQLADRIRDKEFRFKELVVGEYDWARDWEWIDMCVADLRADLVKYLEAPLVEVKEKLRPYPISNDE